MATMHQDLGSNSADEALIMEARAKGTLTPYVNSESREGTSSIDESLPNERKRIEIFILELSEIIQKWKIYLIPNPKKI